MAASRMEPIIQHLRRSVLLRDGVGLTDGELLERFITHRDETAFEALVQRHGPMVLGVCRRVLRNPHDAEDAFQATFLVLARKAASVSPREMVGNWLHGVASTTAIRAKALTARRQGRERQVMNMPEPATGRQDAWDDLQPLLDQELAGLPDRYRLAVVLCDLEGRTRREVARQLKIPEGTLSSRLTTARRMLAKRLARRGLAVSGGSLAGLLSQQASACVPTALLGSTVKVGCLFTAGQAAVSGVISAQVAVLTEGVLKAMLMTKLKTVSLVLLVSLMAVGGGLATNRSAAAEQNAAELKRATPTYAQSDPTPLPAELTEVRLGKSSEDYNAIFDRVTSVVGDYFEIKYANRYEGRIETAPAPVRSNKARSSPSLRRQAVARITALEEGAFSITVQVVKEVESPPVFVETSWKPAGRDTELEQLILRRLLARAGKADRDGTAPVQRDRKQPRKNASDLRKGSTSRQTDKEQLQGVWRVVSVESGGKRSEVEKAVFMVDGNRACWQTGGDEVQGGLYLDPTTNPKSYDLATSQRTIEGIYSLDGDVLRLCYDLAEEATRPGQFSTRPGSRQVLVVLKRQPELKLGIDGYRRADGSRAFPTLVERDEAVPPPPRPQIAAQVPPQAAEQEVSRLREQVKMLERRLAALEGKPGPGSVFTEKEPCRVGQIIVIGNKVTPTSAILKKMPLRPGQVIDHQALREAERRLAEFRATIMVIESDDNSSFKDILIRVKEK